MVTVSISETYDLSTKVNKMTVIGIHTPKKELIQKTYPGLCMNCRYFRIKSVDVTLATAQQLPLGVDQIGLDTDKIRPQDMMNPILYKATSNDSFSTLEARLQGLLYQTSLGSAQLQPPLKGDMAFAEDENATLINDEHNVYYSLLSNRDGWKMSPVQNGVRMKGLIPLVFEKWYTNGENYQGANSGGDLAPILTDSITDGVRSTGVVPVQSVGLRGRPHPMPKLNTTYVTSPGGDGNDVNTGMGAGRPGNAQKEMPDIPPVMLGCIILPPATATTGIIYYRMVTRAYIEFTDVRPITEIASFAQMNQYYASSVYHSDYNEQAKMMDATTNMVDVKNAEIEKIMEGR